MLKRFSHILLFFIVFVDLFLHFETDYPRKPQNDPKMIRKQSEQDPKTSRKWLRFELKLLLKNSSWECFLLNLFDGLLKTFLEL